MSNIANSGAENSHKRITGLVLAGGMSRRMQNRSGDATVGAIDKALMPCAGRPLIAWTLQRLRPQVNEVLINCNRNLEAYAQWGHPLLRDRFEGFAGPLAGIHAALYELNQRPKAELDSQWLLTVPCDCPFFPEDLAQCMLSLASDDRDLVVARTPEAEQPVFLLLRARLLSALEHYLIQHGRKIDQWYQSLRYSVYEFNEISAFRNINTPEDLKVAQGLLASPLLDCEALALDIAAFEHTNVEIQGQMRLQGSKTPMPDRQAQPNDAAIKSASDASSHSVPMIPIEALKGALLDRLRPIERRQWVCLKDLQGQVLAQDLFAGYDVPAHRNTAMDGYALRFKDLHPGAATILPIGERILAGHPSEMLPPASAHALRVMTGAVLPEGFDVVVPQESCRPVDEGVWIPAGQQLGQHVRMAGEDLARGELVIRAGSRLSAIHLGLMASLGIAQARVRGPLKLAILSTGDELIDPSCAGERADGLLFDSNRYLLSALLTRWPSAIVHDAGIVADDPERLEAVLADLGRSHDVIVSSGGVSVGEADFTRSLMARLGQVQFCTVAMRPGRPLALGRVGQALYMGLPGNPVAVAMTFWYFVAPAIDRLLGLETPAWPLRVARAAVRIKKKRGRTEFQRARLETDEDGACLLFVSSNQGSGILSSLSKYPVIAVLEHERGNIEAGESLSYVRIEDLL